MRQIVVVQSPARWPLRIPGVEIVGARSYLTDAAFSEMRGVRVYNLCRAYGYQTIGYYVSLLAAARGHRPLPSVGTLQEIRLAHQIRIASEDLHGLIQSSLRHLKTDTFVLSIYFGRNVARHYDRLSRSLFNQFPAPLLRARFTRTASGNREWLLDRLRPIATSEIPESHRPFLIERAGEYFARPSRRRRPRQVYRYDLAILVNPAEQTPPSNSRAIRKFAQAAQALGMDATVIGPEDIGRVAEFDALFIRETTYVNHHTFRFSRRAASEGLVVLDDPESILRCTNKVFLAETFERRGIPAPKTLVVDDDDAQRIEREVGLPCVLKRPDSSFSQGVVRADTPGELRERLPEVLERSQLAIAQEFVPSEFDWRVGVLAGEVVYCCRYHMARGHWQIVGGSRGSYSYGEVEAVPLDQAPPRVLGLARRSAAAIGGGFYGVDIKPLGRKLLVMEVNDNPSVDCGYEDAVLGDELYRKVMGYFVDRLESRGRARVP